MNESARQRCSDEELANVKGAATHATFGQCVRLAERPFYELCSSYRRKSFIV